MAAFLSPAAFFAIVLLWHTFNVLQPNQGVVCSDGGKIAAMVSGRQESPCMSLAVKYDARWYGWLQRQTQTQALSGPLTTCSPINLNRLQPRNRCARKDENGQKAQMVG